MTKILGLVYRFTWGIPSVAIIFASGVFLSVITGFPQIRFLPKSLSGLAAMFSRKQGSVSGVPPVRALCTALSATVGTGNLVGVAGAICIGGPGAVFWMWISAFFGMAVKFAEATLAVSYRVKENGQWVGGPMYMLQNGLGISWLAKVYAFLGAAACFGVGNTAQINSIVTGINNCLYKTGISHSKAGNLLFGAALAIMIGAVLFGGAQRIGKTAQRLVPAAAAIYLILCLLLLIRQRRLLPEAIRSIFIGAFSPRAVTGGAVGSTVNGMITGCSRGVFSNEAGMGTASIAHAGADVAHPCQQGILGIAEVFLDTIVICTMTALAILSSGVTFSYGIDRGFSLTQDAFSYVYGSWITYLLMMCMCLLAFATVLGWGLYGGRCVQFLFGGKAYPYFAILQTVLIIPGALMQTETVWRISEILNGLMIFPNLIALILLSPKLKQLTQEYDSYSKK